MGGGQLVFPKHLNATENSYEEDIIEAAENGDPQSQFALALLYEHGTDTLTRDPDKAIGLLKKAGRKNITAACLYLGMKYEYGNRVERNLEKAACWYRCAAIRGWAPAQYFLGTLYEQGKGIKKSEFLALAWYGLAAEQYYPGAAEHFKGIQERGVTGNMKGLREKQEKLLGGGGTSCN